MTPDRGGTEPNRACNNSKSGQQLYRVVVSQVVSDISALRTTLDQDLKYLTFALDHSNDQVFSGPAEKLMEDGRQSKIIFYEESQKTANVYANDWQSRLNVLSMAVACNVTPADAV